MKAIYIYSFFLLAIIIENNLSLFGILCPLYPALSISICPLINFTLFAFITVIMAIISGHFSCVSPFVSTYSSALFILAMFFFEKWRKKNKPDTFSFIITTLIPITYFYVLYTLLIFIFYSPSPIKVILPLPLSISLSIMFLTGLEQAKKILNVSEPERIVFGN